VSWRNYRMYAITMGNVMITSFFVCVTVVQTTVGVYLAILAATTPGMISAPVGCFIPDNCYRYNVPERWKHSATIPFYPPHGIPIMCRQQTSEGGTRPHSPRTLLWFASSDIIFHLSSITRLSRHRRFCVPGNRCPRDKVRA